jgi:tetratricopeptide (TPR) repeat protein
MPAAKRTGRGTRPVQRHTSTAPPPVRWTAAPVWLPLLVIGVVTLLAYLPAWHGGMVWDDDAHLTRSDLRSAEGLRRIWFDVGATQQYYPAVHSAFWLFFQLWGADTLGYHLVNIGLHAISAVLLGSILLRLKAPAPWLAAVVFALHPVQVESVAWMTELKNTLSTACFLASALVYLRFDERRETGLYAASLVLFVLALLSKTVTASLPAALLIVFWWMRGRIDWRRDVQPLIPFFVLGLAGGLMTAWFERTLLGAHGAEYQLDPIQRVLLAGRAIWFYAGKLIWPAHLSFVYPRWQIDRADWVQYLYPLGVAVVVFGFWMLRGRTRSPLAVALLYCGMLFPALGFVDVYPFRYSFVADHFQYLACAPMIALLCGGLLAATRFTSLPERTAEVALIVVLGIPLGWLAWRESAQYRNAETLYRSTLVRNPSCWLCYNNLATTRLSGSSAELNEAVAYLTEALRLNPGFAESHNNLGGAYQRLGRLDEALREHQEAFRLNPRLLDARYNVGLVYQAKGQLDQARAEYEAVLRAKPDHPGARTNLGTIAAKQGRADESIRNLSEAVRLDPDNWRAHGNLGGVLLPLGRVDEAIVEQRQAVRLAPNEASARIDLGTALATAGRLDEAAAEFQEAVRLAPESPDAWNGLGAVLGQAGRIDDAIMNFRQAARLQPGAATAHYRLAVALAAGGRTGEAIAEFQEALKLDSALAEAHHDLGAALANSGRFDEAVRHFRETLRLRPDYPGARENLERASRAARPSGR